MIAEFVDGLLLAIGDATVEELRELLGRSDAGEPGYAPKFEAAPVAAAAPAAPRKLARLDHNAALRRSIEASLAAPPVAEITDPESLLSLGTANGASSSLLDAIRHTPAAARPTPAPPIPVTVVEPASNGVRGERHADPEIDSPASGVRPKNGASIRLSDNETLARVSDAGVVIRRKKKA
ncbi:MAG TPA: hypothetical protein VHV30_04500 [Polyangiaceae bacterium]|jgi:hypothetical protein|nr:hypothetical protein [Polyangiaceae bacterium]